MLLLIHISAALAGLLQALWAVIVPSRATLRATGFLGATTLVTGVALTVYTHAPLASACLSGVGYLAALGVLAWVAHRRLVAQSA